MVDKILELIKDILPYFLPFLGIPFWAAIKKTEKTNLTWAGIIAIPLVFDILVAIILYQKDILYWWIIPLLLIATVFLVMFILYFNGEKLWFKPNYWPLPDKNEDKENLSFVFLSIDLVDHSKFYENDLEAIDEQLDNIFNLVHEKIGKKEYKRLLWYTIGDTALYGFKDSRTDLRIREKVLNLAIEIMNEADEQFKIREEPIKIRILLHRATDVLYRKDFNKRRGLAVNIVRKTKVPGDNSSLSITSDFYEKLNDEALKSQFSELDFQLSGANLYGYIPTLKKYYLRVIEEHYAKEQYVFAADFGMKLLKVTDPNDAEGLQKIEQIIQKIDDEKITLFPKRTLKKIYSLKLARHKGEQLSFSNDEHKLLNVYEQKIKKGINYVIQHDQKSYSDKIFVLLLGKSPVDPIVKPLIEKIKKEVDEKSENGSFFHDKCTLCTSKVGSMMALIGDEERLKTILTWLFAPKQNFNQGCRMQGGKERSWHYSSSVLSLMVIIHDKARINKLIDLLLEKDIDWLKEKRESHSIVVLDKIISSIYHALELIQPSWLKQKALKNPKKEKLNESLHNLLDSIVKLEAIDNNQEMSEFILQGFQSIFKTYKLEADLQIGEDFPPAGIHDIFPFSKVEKYYDFMADSTIWDKESGSWGFVLDKTRDYIRLWFQYWEMKLAIQAAKENVN